MYKYEYVGRGDTMWRPRETLDHPLAKLWDTLHNSIAGDGERLGTQATKTHKAWLPLGRRDYWSLSGLGPTLRILFSPRRLGGWSWG